MRQRPIIGSVWASALLALVPGCYTGLDGAAAMSETATDGAPSGGTEPDGSGASADSDGDGVPGGGTDCLDARLHFDRELWPKVVAPHCLGCHVEGGAAAVVDPPARLIFNPTGSTQAMADNLAALQDLAYEDLDGEARLFAKATGSTTHGGAAVLSRDSAKAETLQAWIDLEREGVECDPVDTVIPNVVLEEPTATLRKAMVQLLGRLPTDDEMAAADDEAGLRATLRSALDSELFKPYVVRFFNDYLHTRAGSLNNSFFFGVGMFHYGTQYPRYSENIWLVWDMTSEIWPLHAQLSDEPTELVWHIVSRDEGLDRMLLADYTMMTPKTAYVYNAELPFDDPDPRGDSVQWLPGHTTYFEDGQAIDYPHCGVLSTPSFLGAYPSNAGNIHRARAAAVYRVFLDLDVTLFSSEAGDDDAPDFDVPVTEDPACTVCHALIDPVAATFSRYQNAGARAQLLPEPEWPEELLPAGFGGELLPAEVDPICWLGEQLVAQPEFARTIVDRVYSDLVGRELLGHPGSGETDAAVSASARREEQDYLEQLTERFRESNLNLKSLVVDVVTGSRYRAVDLESDEPFSDEWFEAYGSSRMISPEHLDKKLGATLGVHWDRLAGVSHQILLGGIDSSAVRQRMHTPSPLSASLLRRMAYEVTCEVVVQDFDKPVDDRLLFPLAEASDGLVPPPTESSPDAQRVRDNIRHIFTRLVGTAPGDGDPELEAAYELFYESQLAAQEWLSGGLQPNLWFCDAPGIGTDPTYAVRAWRQVVQYILLSEEFLFQ